MNKIILFLIILLTTNLMSTDQSNQNNITDKKSNSESSFYNFSALSISGKKIEMNQYKGKILLVVNTASKCGFTPQYQGLQKLYTKYKDKGLEILAFPCNQFGKQEPDSNNKIKEFCKVNYGVTFQVFEKIKVNGNEAHPIFKYLKEKLPGILGKGIKWNFTKFIIDRNGKPIKRIKPITKPEKIDKYFEKIL